MFSKKVFAHRGLSGTCPENTLIAFRRAAEAGVKWIETDIDVLGDGTPFLCHDSTLDRTTNKSGSYYELKRADLAGIDAGSWFGNEFAGESLPTLADLISLMNETRLNANFELKSNEAGKDLTVQLVENVLAEMEKLDPEREIIISSFSLPTLMLLRERNKDVAIAPLFEAHTLGTDWRAVMEILAAQYIHPDASALTKAQVKEFRDAGYGVNTWTVNSAEQANKLFNWGVTGIFTDYADKFLYLTK